MGGRVHKLCVEVLCSAGAIGDRRRRSDLIDLILHTYAHTLLNIARSDCWPGLPGSLKGSLHHM